MNEVKLLILQAAGSFALLLLYGVAVIPLAYCLSFSFASPSAAQARPHDFGQSCSPNEQHQSSD